MLALGSRRLRHGAVRLGRCSRQGRPGGLEAAHVAAGGQADRGANERGRCQKAAAFSSDLLSRPCHHNRKSLLVMILSETRYPLVGIMPFALVRKQFQLPHPEQFDSGPGPRLDEAANPNPSILEGLRRHAGRLKRR